MATDQLVFDLIEAEYRRQREGLELIASENFVSPQVLRATGSILTNKYAEGLPRRRYYRGCRVVDAIEQLAIDRACKLFGACWANVQPHSGSQANAALMMAVLQPQDKVLGFDLSHGGHLTHGASVNFSGKLYQAFSYGVSPQTGLIDYDAVAAQAQQERPKLLICGASAYSRDWDYARLRCIADEVGALLWADIAHTAGLIAAKLLNDPLPHCHFITTTTHKTLRGPRGGMLLMGTDFANPLGLQDRRGRTKKMSAVLDAGVFPGTQGGPLMHVIAAKALAFQEAQEPAFVGYSQQVLRNAHAMAQAFLARGYEVVSGGTDNHMLLLDLRNKQLTGKVAAHALARAGITVNKNLVPFDSQPPSITSGIRLGTPALTTRGLVEDDMREVVSWIDQVLRAPADSAVLQRIQQAVAEKMRERPLFQPDNDAE